jgi:hypothetical protein
MVFRARRDRMRSITNFLLLFWIAHFAIGGLARAASSGPDHLLGGLALLGVPHETGLAIVAMEGFAEFAVAGLLLLALLIRLIGVAHEQVDASRYMEWAACAALVLFSFKLPLVQLGGADAGTLGLGYATATFFALSAFAWTWRGAAPDAAFPRVPGEIDNDRLEDFVRSEHWPDMQGVRETVSDRELAPLVKARLAAFIADAAYPMRKGPTQ